MKRLRLFFILGLVGMLTIAGFSQSHSPKIAIVSQVDTMVTHVYFDPIHNIKKEENIFNYGAYTMNDLLNKFERSQIEAFQMETPFWFGRMSYKNFIGKPTNKLKGWLTSLKQQQDVDYLIVILHKWNPDPTINFKFLDGIHYGIVSYATTRDAITLFSMVGYYIFSTSDFREITLDPNHDRYVITNVSLENSMSFNEMINLPDPYFELCQDKLRNIADTRDAEIWRVMKKELGK